jgi:hypothetical protein
MYIRPHGAGASGSSSSAEPSLHTPELDCLWREAFGEPSSAFDALLPCLRASLPEGAAGDEVVTRALGDWCLRQLAPRALPEEDPCHSLEACWAEGLIPDRALVGLALQLARRRHLLGWALQKILILARREPDLSSSTAHSLFFEQLAQQLLRSGAVTEEWEIWRRDEPALFCQLQSECERRADFCDEARRLVGSQDVALGVRTEWLLRTPALESLKKAMVARLWSRLQPAADEGPEHCVQWLRRAREQLLQAGVQIEIPAQWHQAWRAADFDAAGLGLDLATAPALLRLLHEVKDDQGLLDLTRHLLGRHPSAVLHSYMWPEIFILLQNVEELTVPAWKALLEILADRDALAPIALALLSFQKAPEGRSTEWVEVALYAACRRLEPGSLDCLGHRDALRASLVLQARDEWSRAVSREVLEQALVRFLDSESDGQSIAAKVWLTHQLMLALGPTLSGPSATDRAGALIMIARHLASSISSGLDWQGSALLDRPTRRLVWRAFQEMAQESVAGYWLRERLQDRAPNVLLGLATLCGWHEVERGGPIAEEPLRAWSTALLPSHMMQRGEILEQFLRVLSIGGPREAAEPELLWSPLEQLRGLLGASALLCLSDPLSPDTLRVVTRNRWLSCAVLQQLFSDRQLSLRPYLAAREPLQLLGGVVLPTLMVTGIRSYSGSEALPMPPALRTRFMAHSMDMIPTLQTLGSFETLSRVLADQRSDLATIGSLIQGCLLRLDFCLSRDQVALLLARLVAETGREFMRRVPNQDCLPALTLALLDGLVRMPNPVGEEAQKDHDLLITQFAQLMKELRIGIAPPGLWGGSWGVILQQRVLFYSGSHHPVSSWQAVTALLDRLFNRLEPRPFPEPEAVTGEIARLMMVLGRAAGHGVLGHAMVWLSVNPPVDPDLPSPDCLALLRRFRVRSLEGEEFSTREILGMPENLRAQAAFLEHAPTNRAMTWLIFNWMCQEGELSRAERLHGWFARLNRELGLEAACRARLFAARRALMVGGDDPMALHLVEQLMPMGARLEVNQAISDEWKFLLASVPGENLLGHWGYVQAIVDLLLRRSGEEFPWGAFECNSAVAALAWLIRATPEGQPCDLARILEHEPQRVGLLVRQDPKGFPTRTAEMLSARALTAVASDDLIGMLRLLTEMAGQPSLPRSEQAFAGRLPVLLLAFSQKAWHETGELRTSLESMQHILADACQREQPVEILRQQILLVLMAIVERGLPGHAACCEALTQMPVLESLEWAELRALAESWRQQVVPAAVAAEHAPDWVPGWIEAMLTAGDASWRWIEWSRAITLEMEALAVPPTAVQGTLPQDWAALPLEDQVSRVWAQWLQLARDPSLREALLDCIGPLAQLLRDSAAPALHPRPDQFKSWFLGRLFEIGAAPSLLGSEGLEETIHALCSGLADLTPQTCSVGWSQCVERLESAAFHPSSLEHRVKVNLGRALRDRAIDLIGQLLETPEDAHLKSKIQIACHQWGSNSSVGGMSQQTLMAAWEDPYPLQHDLRRVGGLIAERPDAPAVSPSQAHPRSTDLDRRLIFSFRQEMPRMLLAEELLDLVVQTIMDLPEQAEELDVSSVAQACAEWMFTDEEKQYELFPKLKATLLAAKREDPTPADAMRAIALCLGAALAIWKVSPVRPSAPGE